MEIERKFLISSLPDGLSNYPFSLITQGYLAVEPKGNEVRVRKENSNFFMTVKSNGTIKRNEYEINLSEAQFNAFWPIASKRQVVKKRYYIPIQRWVIELDVFSGKLKGLIIAEVEFKNTVEAKLFNTPAWFGEEITYNPKFKNKRLQSLSRLSELFDDILI